MNRVGNLTGKALLLAMLLVSKAVFAQQQCDGTTLAAADDYNALIFGPYTAVASDVQGRLAVQGKLSLNHYALADGLTAASAGVSVIVGGDFDFPSGQIYYGDVIVGGTASVGATILNGSLTDRAPVPVDFVAAKQQMESLALALSQLPANGTQVFQWGGFQLHGDGVSKLQVFSLDGAQVLSAHTFTVQSIPAGATVVFNISGANTGLTNMSLDSLASHRERVVFNFYEAGQLTLGGIGVEGSILAPNAVIDNPQGVVRGTVIAASWNGMMQLNHHPFAGCFEGVTLGGGNSAPVAGNLTVNTLEDTGVAVDLPASDPDGDLLSYEIVAAPGFGSLTGDAPNLTYTPAADYNGVDSFTYRANDGELNSEIATVTINIAAVNDAPVADDATVATTEDTAVAVLLTATDVDGDTLSFQITRFPASGTLSGTALNLTYTPNANFFGSDSFEFRVDDGAASSPPATVGITVTPVGGDAPTADPQQLQTDENRALDIVLTGADPDGDPIDFQIVALPANGMLTGQAPNLIYLPNAYYEGPDAFSFLTSDGTLQSAPAVVDIQVVGQGNNPPRITSEAIDKHVLKPGTGQPEAFDLRGWEQWDDTNSTHPNTPRWTVSADGTVATQWNNAPGSALIGPADMSNTRIDGTLRVNTSSDDDHIGFVFGYQEPGRHYLFDWKKNPQGEVGQRGMRLIRGNAPGDSVLLYSNDIRWASFTDYDFTLSFQSGFISITISQAGAVVDSFSIYDALYTDGRFGFYCGSQERVQFRGFSTERLANAVYTYAVTAADPDGDAIVYRLLDAPEGMSIDAATGLITWFTDQNNPGSFPVLIEVEDPFGATDQQAFELVVTDDAPVFVGAPTTIAYAGETYADKLTAFDPDPRDTLTYSLVDAPPGLTVNPATGELNWLPGSFDIGSHPVSAEVADSQGNVGALDYVMKVVQRPPNEPPQFVSQPPLLATVGRAYRYTPQATDADGDSIQYGFAGAVPYHMQIFDGTTVTWTPTADQVTDWTVTVDAWDGRGGVAEQTFVIRVQALDDNSAPDITSQPGTSADIGTTYQYQVTASDSDGDELSYTLLSAPPTMIIDSASGLVQWSPVADDAGFHDIGLRVEDGRGGFDEQAYTLAVNDPLANQAPSITSVPSTQAQPAVQYSYQVLAIDPDGDSLMYMLPTAPAGMAIDAGGRVSWTPGATQTGANPVVVEVTDGNGGSARQSYTVLVQQGGSDGSNNGPSITSTPGFAIEAGLEYVYAVTASDIDGDTLNVRLLQGPAGMAVDAAGVVRWLTTATDVGEHTVRVEVADGRGGTAQQGYRLTVFEAGAPPSNTPPQIGSAPPGTGTVGLEYRYAIQATDADGDALSYTLLQGPAGMTVDAGGVLTWIPAAAGERSVRIRVGDGQSFVEQGWTLRISGPVQNTPPAVDSVPPMSAKVGFEYRYAIQASDADGDTLNYTLLDGPAGMTVSAAGVVSWTPAAVGSQPVFVRVDDGQAFVRQGWTVQVSAAAIPLQATLAVSPPSVELNATADFTIGYSGAAGPVSFALTVDGVAVPVDPLTGTASWVADSVGLKTATAIVSDPFASDSATVTFSVIDPNATSTPPIVSLTTPDFEEEVTAPRDAIGSVSDPDGDLLSWSLLVQSRGADLTEFTTLASGTGAITDGVIGQIDPTMLINGLYSVILQATDSAGNVSQDVRVIRVTGDLKVGNFSVTFEDFSAPVAGLPVTVLRTYDSRRRNENLDFGFGWSVDYQNVRVQESRDIGFSWSLIEEDLGFFSQWCVRPNGDPTVTVRMPDGEVESFVARAEPECTQLVPTVDVAIVFDPIDGTDTTLEQTDFGTVRIVGNNIVDLGAPGVPIDPDAYRLTTPEGLVFTLDQGFGIRQVLEPNGSTLSYSDAGVVHSQGFSLTFTRDTQGRITDITAPDGTSMTYAYDANGDLERFTDQASQTTNYTYRAGLEHYLEDILDPRGIRVSRNEYDADGRLIAIIDADGNRIEYTHDVVGRTETVRDRRGNTTVYVYDDEGNVLVETNALNETTTRSYDADRNVLTETNHLGETMTWTYDERGNVLTETNDLGETTTSTYDDRNLLLTVVDPLGLSVMTNVYDTRNTNLETMTDALGQTTTFFWDAGIGGCSTGASEGSLDAEGNRTTIQPQCVGPFAELPLWEEDARGVRTSFAYDALGRVLTETTTRTDASGVEQTLVTTMAYDDKGRVTSVTDPAGNVTITEYNGIDKEAATIDPNLNRTEYEYDDRGNRVLTRYADNTTETMAYDPEGNLISQTDRLGRTTRMTYDAANRLLETIFPDDTPGNDADNPRTTNEYDGAGRLTASIDERGNRTEYAYDRAGRQILIRNALNEETRFEYDARGLRTAMIDALNRRTQYVYDNVGRLTETIYPDDTPGDTSDNLRMQTGYDAIGRKTSETDLAGLTTRFEYDGVGNLTAVIDALNQRTEYGYDEQSNKIAQTDAEFRTTAWGYDNAGRVTSRTLPEGQQETFGYDNASNRTGHIDFNGASHTFGFDNLNRETTATYADGIVVTTTYTDTGQVETVTDDRGTTSFAYDERERLTRITYPTGRTIDYGYDDAGNRTSLTTANQALTYTFDVLNRLETVTDEAGTTTYGYDAVGSRASLDYANGTRTSYAYDPLNRLLELSHFDTTDTLIDRHTYTLGANGNRLQHAELNGRTVDYAYDDLSRLLTEAVTDSTLGNRSASWTYDSVGNRLTQVETDTAGSTTTTYVYDNNDRLTSETATGTAPSATSYSYDNNGNTLSHTADGIKTTYAYDSRNRLISLNAGQVTYRYDANGIRMSETAAGLTTNYLVDPSRDYAQVIEESLDLSTEAEVRYSYGDDLIAQHQRTSPTATESRTFHYDGLGSTRLLTDLTGAITDSYAFTAFGELEGSTGITQNDYLYTGEQYDPNLGFYYLRARYYNPTIGRFPAMDTWRGRVSVAITLNKYLYANASPTDFVDPSGLKSLPEVGVALNIQARQALLARSFVRATAITCVAIATASATSPAVDTFTDKGPARVCKGFLVRVQFQKSPVSGGTTSHTWARTLAGGPPFGVRVRSVEALMKTMFHSRPDWWPNAIEPALISLIAEQSKRLNQLPPHGAPPGWTNKEYVIHNRAEYRVDVESIRGRNFQAF